MRQRTILRGFFVFVAMAGSVVLPAMAADGDGSSRQRSGKSARGQGTFDVSPLGWDADIIMNPIISQVTRYYNLTEQQEEYTRLLMTQRVKRFLGQNEREVRSLMAEYWDYQFSGQLPPPAAVQEFAQRAQPLLASIHKEIIDGNMKWRDILDEGQKTLHDRDLRHIDQAFKKFDDQFERWSRGDVRPGDFPSRVGRQPRRLMNAEDAWQYYVRLFIQDYQLDAGQQEAAQSVLRELRKQAVDYRESRREEFAQLDAAYAELEGGEPKKDPEVLKELKAKRMELDKKRESLESRISKDLFAKLKKQLEAIPRADQRQTYAEKKQRLRKKAEQAMAAYRKRQAATKPAGETQPAGQTQPADSEAPVAAEMDKTTQPEAVQAPEG